MLVILHLCASPNENSALVCGGEVQVFFICLAKLDFFDSALSIPCLLSILVIANLYVLYDFHVLAESESSVHGNRISSIHGVEYSTLAFSFF